MHVYGSGPLVAGLSVARVAPDAPPEAQIDMPGAMDIVAERPRRFARHSAQHMEHVRAGKRVAQALAKEKATKDNKGR